MRVLEHKGSENHASVQGNRLQRAMVRKFVVESGMLKREFFPPSSAGEVKHIFLPLDSGFVVFLISLDTSTPFLGPHVKFSAARGGKEGSSTASMVFALCLLGNDDCGDSSLNSEHGHA